MSFFFRWCVVYNLPLRAIFSNVLSKVYLHVPHHGTQAFLLSRCRQSIAKERIIVGAINRIIAKPFESLADAKEVIALLFKRETRLSKFIYFFFGSQQFHFPYRLSKLVVDRGSG